MDGPERRAFSDRLIMNPSTASDRRPGASGIPGLEPLDSAPGPAKPVDPERARAMVEHVLGRAQRPGSALKRRVNVIRLPRAVLWGAGALVAATAAAAAANDLSPARWLKAIVQTTAPAAPTAPPSIRVADKRALVAQETSPDDDPPPSLEREQPVNTVPRAAARDLPPEAPPRRRAGATPVETKRGDVAPSKVAPEAVDLLQRANELRLQQEYSEALELYLRVTQRYPQSLQAQVARISAANLRLQQFGDARGAERLYRDASLQGGQLSAEAEFGVAESHRVRGDTARERRALRAFLQRHPESPLARMARSRLAAIAEP